MLIISKEEHLLSKPVSKSYLFNRQIRVYQNGSLSDEKPVYTGVPQGLILGPLLFVLFFNDISNHLKYSKIVKYGDDTVIFCENGRLPTIEHQLDEDVKNLSRWFEENELLINLKPGKTELLLFGTSQRIAKINKSFEVKFNNQYINETKSYRYLDVEVDHTLNLNPHFDKTYKKMTSRLRLLNKLRPNMTASAAASIYNMVIVPLFPYCSLLKPTLTPTQINRILSFERRAKEIIGYKQRQKKQVNLVNIRKQRISSFVLKVVMGKVGDPLKNYFEFLNTTVNTRNKIILLPLLKLKLEYGRRSKKYLGAKIFNDLPIEVRKHCKEKNFNRILKYLFFLNYILLILHIVLYVPVSTLLFMYSCCPVFHLE